MNTFNEQPVNKEEKDEIEIDLGQLFAVILGKLWIILTAGLAFAVVALLITKIFMTPIYTSTTKIYVLNRASEEAGLTSADLTSSTQLTKDYQQLILSRTVLEQVIVNQNLDITYDGLADKIEVTTPVDTRILSIMVSDPDPKAAKDIADEVRKVSADHIQQVMDIQSVNTVEEANLAVDPTSPSMKKNSLIGGALGILLSMGIIILIFIIDDHIRTPDDVERYLGLSVLGTIPIVEQDKKNPQGSKKNQKSGKAIQKKKR